MEGGIPWPGCCREGHKNILEQRLTEDNWGGLLATLCVRTLKARCVEVLQGSRDMEIPPASERPAVARSDDVRGPVRDGVRLDGKWKHQ